MPPVGNDPTSPVCSGDIWLLIRQIGMCNYPWWYPNGAKKNAIDFFIYGGEVLPLAGSSTANLTINIDGSSAFCICETQLIETATDNVTFLGQRPLLIQLQDTGSGRLVSNIPIAADNWFGTAQRPYVWPVPKIIAPNATLQVTVQNLEATERNVRIAFAGFKIFNFVPV